MNKKLLLEIEKLKSLISYDRTSYDNNLNIDLKKIVNEEIPPPTYTYQQSQGWDEDYNVVEIGPYNNPKYPTMLDVKTPVVTKPRQEPSIKQFNSETSMKDFLGSNVQVKKFVEGDKLSTGKPAPVGSEYFQKADGTKYCLPSAEWVKMHTDKKYVYQFTNQKTGEIFGLKFALDKTQNLGGVEYTGEEISKMCPGGNNGWIFVLDPNTKPITMFYNSKTGKPFNPSKDGNSQSDFDDWWDDWKFWVELGVGVLASFVGGGIAVGVLAWAESAVLAAEVGSVAYRVASLLVTLGESSFLGGTTSWLEVTMQMLVEAGMMTPIALEYLEEGDVNDAVLAWAFCLLPFLTELPFVARFIKTGKLTKSQAEVYTKEILGAIKSAGGYKAVTRSIEAEWTMVSSLSKESRDLYMGMKRAIVENPKILEEGFNLGLKQNAESIMKVAEKNSDPVVKKVLYQVNNQINPLPIIGGKGIIPVLARSFAVVGATLLSSTAVLDYFKSLGLSKEVAENLKKQAEKSINSSQYWKDLASLNLEFGLDNRTAEQQLAALKQYTEEKPDAINEMLNSQVAQENFFNQEKIDSLAIIQANKYKDSYTFGQKQKDLLGNQEFLNANEMLRINSKKKTIEKLLKLNGYIIQEWTDTSNKTKWTFVTDQSVNGEIVFQEDKTYVVYVGGKKIN